MSAVKEELRQSLAWPDQYAPSAWALLQGSSDSAQWFIRIYTLSRVTGSQDAPLMMPRSSAPYLPVDKRLVTAVRRRIGSGNAKGALEGALLATLMRREDRLEVADALVEALGRPPRHVSAQCQVALADTGVPLRHFTLGTLGGTKLAGSVSTWASDTIRRTSDGNGVIFWFSEPTIELSLAKPGYQHVRKEFFFKERNSTLVWRTRLAWQRTI